MKAPVCGMNVDPATAKWSHEHRGATYYFCNPGCQKKFVADPERYLKGTPSASAMMDPEAPQFVQLQMKPRGSGPKPVPPAGSAPKAAAYVCPMDPEVRSDRPGACPKCGMALEPPTVSAVEEENPELVDMTRRFYIATALTVPVFLMAMGEMLPGAPLQGLMSQTTQGWLEMALSTPVVLWAGWPFFQRIWVSFVNRHLNMFTLIGIGTGAG